MTDHRSCAVAVCKNHGSKTKGTDILYHRFPVDPVVRKAWLSRCKRADTNFNLNYARVCSHHFLAEDYKRDLMNELLGLPCKRLLKPSAIPSVNLGQGELCLDGDVATGCISKTRRQQRYEARVTQKTVEHVIHELSPEEPKDPECDKEKSAVYGEDEKESLKKRIKMLEQSLRKSFTQISELRKQNVVLKRKLKLRKLCSAQRKPPHSNNSLYSPWIRDNAEAIAKGVSKIFSTTQLKYLMKPPKNEKKRVHWAPEDISSALSDRAISRRGYEHFRRKGYPLPGISTLRRWTEQFICRPGILREVLQILKPQAAELTQRQKLCILSFDEMNVDSRISYDQKLDKIWGPHSNVQVVMARGLEKNWKQPIFYDFDTTMTAELLKKIIVAVEETGFQVVGVVCDMGGKNRRVWNELGISVIKTFFNNPADTSRRIWVFFDVPHLLKLLRNHFLDTELTLRDGTKISKKELQVLLAKDNNELKLTFNLSQRHLTVQGRERQHVRLAAQVFSNRTATALSYVTGNEPMAKFFKTINDGFDVLNSRLPVDKNPCKSGFGMTFDMQDSILSAMKLEIYHMRVGKCKTLLPFQQGFLMAIESLRGLYRFYKSISGTYILTCRLNQDCLENFFSRIRLVGGFNDHPQPVEVRLRIRLLILSSSAGEIELSSAASVASENSRDSENCLMEEDGLQFMTHDLFCDLTTAASQTSNASQHALITSDSMGPVENVSGWLADQDISPDCGMEALKYVAGYVAFRCSKYDQNLGKPTGQLTVKERDCSSWIQLLSRGGLRVPTESWMSTIKLFELTFALFHGQQLNMDENVMASLSHELQHKFPTIHKKIIKMYTRTRTFIRIRHLNTKINERQQMRGSRKKTKQFMSSQPPNLEINAGSGKRRCTKTSFNPEGSQINK